MPVRVWAGCSATPAKPPQRLIVVPAVSRARKRTTCSSSRSLPIHYGGTAGARGAEKLTWADWLTKRCLRRRPPAAVRDPGGPRTTGCCSTASSGPTTGCCALTGPRSSTARTRRRSRRPRRCCIARASRPTRARSLLDGLDENAHKHAFGVSEDLKYALREAIELLGNEAARQLRAQARGKEGLLLRARTSSTPRTQPRVPAAGVPAAVHVLHRGAARAGLRADPARARSTSRATAWRRCATWSWCSSTRRRRARASTSTPAFAACSAWCRRAVAHAAQQPRWTSAAACEMPSRSRPSTAVCSTRRPRRC